MSQPFGAKVLVGPPVSTGTIESGPQITGDWPAAGAKLYFTSWTSTDFVPYRVDGVGRMDVYEATWIPAGWTIRSGDANWDGVFDQLDLVQVLQNSEYLTGGSASWEQGDWNADGEFDRADLVLALQDGGYGQGPRAALAAVPEPSAVALILVGLLSLGLVWKRSRQI